MENEMRELYFDWLCSLVCEPPSRKDIYRKLLRRLHETEFTFSLEMDGNRFEDGINLRYVFGVRNGYKDTQIAVGLDNGPCSVLEMMVALADRCEETIMSNSEYGNRTHIWFWSMIKSMALDSQAVIKYDAMYVDHCVDLMLNRQYSSNGAGGLFTLKRPPRDMRDVDIWCQLMWWLNENEKE